MLFALAGRSPCTACSGIACENSYGLQLKTTSQLAGQARKASRNLKLTEAGVARLNSKTEREGSDLSIHSSIQKARISRSK
jgi:hypothetical protein